VWNSGAGPPGHADRPHHHFMTCEAWRPGRAGDPPRGLDQDRRPLRRQVLKRPDIRAMPGIGPVPQIGQSPSPWLSNQPVQPGPLRSTIETFCFGTGAQTADFSILPDAVSRPRMQHRPNSTQSEAEPNSRQHDNLQEFRHPQIKPVTKSSALFRSVARSRFVS
jgi:hypothetical protein